MMNGPFEISEDTPVYVISVAAELSGLHPQTLRTYDRLGLVSPGRATGRGRRYSARDIHQLREIQRLSQEIGINLTGIKRILELERAVDDLRTALNALHGENMRLRNELESSRAMAARHGAGRRGGELLPINSARITFWQTGSGNSGLPGE